MNTNVSQVTTLYIAMFNRAPDAGGLQYWTGLLDSGTSLATVAQKMYETDPARAYYPAGASNSDVISSFYKYVLGRDPDQGGLTYWKQFLDAGKSFGEVAAAMIDVVNNYTGSDSAGLKSKALFENKIQIAQTFATTDGSIEGAKTALTGVTDDATAAATKAAAMFSNWFDTLRANSVLAPYTSGNDSITGTEGNDSIDAGAGQDTVNGNGGNDIIYGNSGDDKLYGGPGQDSIDGGTGADYIEAGSYYSYSSVPGYYDASGKWVSGYSIYTLDATNEVLKGGGGADSIYGGYGADLILGEDGADYIQGEWYNFSVYGGDIINPSNLKTAFNDTIYGGGGDDTIYGGQGDDLIDGGDGNDRLSGDAGADTIYGGAGNDTVYGEGSDSVDLGGGADIFYYTRTDANAFVVVRGGEGADEFNIYTNNNATDRLVIDLSETVPVKDVVNISLSSYTHPAAPVEIVGFDLALDKINLPTSFDLYGKYYSSGSLYSAYNPIETNYQGVITTSYVQIVNSTATPWSPTSANPIDAKGKGVFVIQGAAAASESTTDVAAFLDPYGNNAKYDNKAEHYFLVNVANKGVGIYLFTDDTGADNSINSDELTPVALLVGLNTSQISQLNANFMVN